MRLRGPNFEVKFGLIYYTDAICRLSSRDVFCFPYLLYLFTYYIDVSNIQNHCFTYLGTDIIMRIQYIYNHN